MHFVHARIASRGADLDSIGDDVALVRAVIDRQDVPRPSVH